MKDKEWLKEKVREIARRVGDEHLYINIDTMLKLIDQLDEPEKVVVPKFVANLIKVLKADEELTSVSDALYYGAKDDEEESVTDWRDENVDKFAKAWLDYPDIEIEKEPLFYVSERDEEYGGFWFLSKNNNGDISIGVNRDWSEVDWDRLKLTEQEIKDYDPRYWAFRNPVEEEENER